MESPLVYAKPRAEVIPSMIETKVSYDARLRNTLNSVSRTIVDYRASFCLYYLFRGALCSGFFAIALFEEPFQILTIIMELVRGWLSSDPLVQSVNVAFTFQFNHLLKTFFKILGFFCADCLSQIDRVIEEYKLLSLDQEVISRHSGCEGARKEFESSWGLTLDSLQKKYSTR